LENIDTDVDIKRAWEIIRETIKISAQASYVIMNLRSISHGSMKDAQNYKIIGNNPNCSGYRIQAK
jgi:hypothetical protein